MDDLIKVSDYFQYLTPEERALCDTGLRQGYMAIPAPTTGLHLVCYGALCAFDDKPCVILLPEQGGRRQLRVWVPEIKALPRVTQVAVEAGVSISRVCPIWVRLVGSVEAERAEAVAKLIAQEAGFSGTSSVDEGSST